MKKQRDEFYIGELWPKRFYRLDQLMSYITGMAYNLVYFILPQGTVSTLFTILLAVIAARYLYSFIMWVIRKIPGGMN